MVELELDGREVIGIRTEDDSLSFEITNNHYQNVFIGVDIYATLTDGSDVHSSMSIDPYIQGNVHETGNRAHLFHLKVPKQMRGRGIGSTLMDIYKQYVEQAGFIRVSGRIGNGGTAEFMEKYGINERYLHVVQIPGDAVNQSIDKSVVLGTKDDAINAANKPSAEAAEIMRGVPVSDAFGRQR